MANAFEHVVSRPILNGYIQFTATPELVAAEYGLKTVTVADIRRWLEENDQRATHAAFIRQLSIPGYAPGADRVVRLTIQNMRDAA
jgi:hypothetical protein